uniref:Bromodomain adjacent to zinc finger domain 2B n=1 Tax=Nothobranchius furzeri TaxID=105023 RepID=A0A8C6NQ56_NOTFU
IVCVGEKEFAFNSFCYHLFSEWWRAAEAHGRGAAAFLPSFIGFPPFFAPHIPPNHNASPVQIRTSGKNSHDPPKGTALLKDAFSDHFPDSNNLVLPPHPKSTLPYDEIFPKARKKQASTSLASNSESGTSSDSSSDGSLSSDLEDLAEDDEDDDDDDEDDEEEDKQRDLSDPENDRPLLKELQDRKDTRVRKVASNPPTLVPLPCSVSPPALSQTSALGLQSSRSRTEGPQQHFSVIQSTGLAANPKPLALLTQPRRESSPSSSPIALTTSPRTLMSQGQTFPAEQKKQQQGPNKSPKRTSLSSPPLPLVPPPPPQNNHSNLFLSSALLGLPEPHHPNGVIQSTTQDAPLALITKPRKDSTPKSKVQNPGLGQADPLAAWKGFSQNHLVQSLVDLFRGGESGIGIPGVSIPGVGIPGVGIPGTCNPTAGLPANKESDDSGDDDDDDDEDDDLEEEDEEDSDDSLSESDSNSDSDISGKKVKESKLLPSGSSKKEMTSHRLTKGPELLNTSTNHTATSCSPLNLQVIKSPTIATSSSALAYHSSASSSSYSLGKRKRVMDEKELMAPLELGWRRETRIKSVAGRPQGEVAYYAPCGKKLRQYPDVMKGLQWTLLKEEEVVPRILAMEGRRGRPPNSERHLAGDGAKMNRRRKGRPPNVGDPHAPEGPSPSEVKLLRKLEAQEIARQAAQMKLMRKLEKQALARAAKEARRQQAIMAAEERRKQKEQIKILKQQEKIKRIQQIRMEKELRAQQILEAKRKKKEEAANAKILEAEKRIKEKELRRQQAEILKHQERERRRQHVMLMKAVEARKKAEERERLRQEKRDEKRLNKERKLEQRRLELEIARELKKPNEDMCLSDHKPLPEFSRIPGLILPGRAVSDCLMLMQFLRGFGKVLGLDLNADVPTLGMLQEGLLNVGDSMGQVQDLLVKLLSLAVCDPGLPPGHKTKTMLGDHLTNVGINRDNVSEVLQMYMSSHCANTDLAPLALSLKTKAFQAHTPAQKASILGFLANELACNVAIVVSQLKLRTFCSVGAFYNQYGCFLSFQQHHQTRKKLFEISHSLRSMMYGQDRYRRRYWVLPHCGGVFIEAMESGEGGVVEIAAEEFKVKEEPQEIGLHKEKSASLDGQNIRTQSLEQQKEDKKEQGGKKNSQSVFYQQSSCVSKLCMRRDVGKNFKTEDKESPSAASTPSMVITNHTTNIPPPASTSLSFPCLTAPRESPGNTPPTSSPAPSPHLSFQASDQLLRVLTERSGHWFSLLPRNPCDLSSITSTPPGVPRGSPQASSTPGRPRSPPPSPALPLTPSAASASASPHHPLKSGASLLGVSFGSWPSGVISPSLPLCSSPSPMPGHSLEGNTAASVSSKSESPLPRIEKSSSMPSPALEMPKSIDYSVPRPIPEDLLTGWWRVSHIEQLRSLVDSLHSRGIREKVLHRQIQKYLEIIPQVCTKHKDVAMIELHELEESQVSVESVRGWCVEEQAMEMDIAMLQQVEELERKVTAASLQVKGWTYVDPQSEREDLVYYEHKPPTKSAPASASAADKDSRDSKEHLEERGEKGGVMRHPDNPLDIAVTRLADLERNIERRYLRSPLGTTIQIRLDNVGTVTVPAPAPSTSADREGGEEEVAHGMKVWRKALTEVRSAAQLAMCIQQLQKSIAWERSIMKVYCQICKKGDNEDLLLLCDGCDKGCHTYCHKPKITSIPEGDWYCPACISSVTKAFFIFTLTSRNKIRGGKKGGETKKNGKQTGNGEASEEDSASATSTPKKGVKDTSRKRKTEDSSPALTPANQESPVCVKRAKTARDNNRDLGLCRLLLAELERHQDAWPFLTPVNLKSVPGYKKVIKKPMDFSTIREKLVSSQYQNLETFIIDVNLVFDNCEKFNEDNSDIGRAGHNMRKFFEKRWTELLKQT